jgi:hypothetical protein
MITNESFFRNATCRRTTADVRAPRSSLVGPSPRPSPAPRQAQREVAEVNSPAAPAVFTSRPQRSCLPNLSPIILPLRKNPSAPLLAVAHSHACFRMSLPATGSTRFDPSGVLTTDSLGRFDCFCAVAPGRAPDVLRRTWRISSSYDPISANEGHAAITRPVIVGSATAMFAARLATLPIVRSTHGRTPPRWPDLESTVSARYRYVMRSVRRRKATGRLCSLPT